MTEQTDPTVSSVVIDNATGIQNSLLNAGDVVNVKATFSESVIVDNASGTPTLTIVVGSNNRTATYAFVSTNNIDNDSLVFQYTIQPGDNDTNGISIDNASGIALNGGTIRDASGNYATITHSSVDNNSSYMVDNTAPAILEETYTFTAATSDVITTSTAHGLVNDDTVTVTTSASDLPAGLAVDTSYNVLATPASDTLTFSTLKDGTVVDITDTGSGTHTLNVAHVSFTSSSSGSECPLCKENSVLSITVTFNDNVTVTGNPELYFFIVNNNRSATFLSSSSGSTSLVFQYSVQGLATDPRDSSGLSIGANALYLPSGTTIKDLAGNDATITHSSVPDNKNYRTK